MTRRAVGAGQRVAAAAALVALGMAPATARAQPRPPAAHPRQARAELGLRLGAGLPICGSDCSPRVGPAGRFHILFGLSRVVWLGASTELFDLRYLDHATGEQLQETSGTLQVLMRLYPVMGRRAGLFFDLGAGMTTASGGGPAAGIGAGVPIVIVPGLRIAPYGAATFGPPQAEVCMSAVASGASGTGSACTADPPESGTANAGVEVTAQF